MILATHGIVGSSIVQIVYDADAQAFFDRVATAGGTLSNTEKLAVNQLVLDMKDDGIWTKMKAIYPMVGGGTGTTAARQAACAQNLKSSSFTGTFTSGWTFASTGVTPNGSSAYMDTSLIPNTSLLLNSVSISYYNRTASAASSSFSVSMGCSLSATNNIALVIKRGFDNLRYVAIYSDTFSANATTTSNWQGFWVGNKQSSNNLKLIQNNTTLGNNITTNINTSIPNVPIYIGVLNGTSAPVSQTFDNKQCAFASIGDGLTDSEASNLYTAVQAFQTTLSRNV
jgi:hypothetical protein